MVSAALLEEHVCGVGDGGPRGRAPAHVADILQGVERVLFLRVVRQTYLRPLLVGELHYTCRDKQ